MSLYEVNTEIDWQNRLVKILLSSTGVVPSSLVGYLIDSEGQPVTKKISMTSLTDTSYSYGEGYFYVDSNIKESYGLTGVASNSGEASSTTVMFANSGQNLAKKDDHYLQEKIRFFRGDHTRTYAVSEVSDNILRIDESNSYNDDLHIVAGDIVQSTGDSPAYYTVSGTVSEDDGATVNIVLDRDVDTVANGHEVVVCPSTTITDYEHNIGADGINKITFTALDSRRTSSISGAIQTDWPSATSGNDFHDMWIDPTALEPGMEFRVGDYVHVSDEILSARYYTEIISKINHTGFIVADVGSAVLAITGWAQIYRQEDYAINYCPRVKEQMRAVVEDSSTTQKVAISTVALQIPELEINFNEYDSAVSSIGTLSHIHVGPIHVNGVSVTAGLENLSATLYANDQTTIATWSIPSYKNFAAAGDNNGMFYDSTNGVFVLTTTRTFAQADMMTLEATVTFNGKDITKRITVAAVPVV